MTFWPVPGSQMVGTARKLERKAKIRRAGSGEKGSPAPYAVFASLSKFMLSPLSRSLEQANWWQAFGHVHRRESILHLIDSHKVRSITFNENTSQLYSNSWFKDGMLNLKLSCRAANNCRSSDNVRLKWPYVRGNLNFGRTLCSDNLPNNK